LDEDGVGTDREHEPSERPWDRLRVDAEEPISRLLRAIDQRVETAHLELKLGRADVLKLPVEGPRRCSGRQCELGKHDAYGGARNGDRRFSELASGQAPKSQFRRACGARALDGEAEQRLVELARPLTAGHGNPDRGLDHVARRGRERGWRRLSY